MSYEGYEVLLCVNGHMYHEDAYSFSTLGWACPTCDGGLAWWCSVDQTNDSGIRPKMVKWKEAVTETCPCCGHVKRIEPERYCLPTNYGHRGHPACSDMPEVLIELKYPRGYPEEYMVDGEIDDVR